MFCNVRHFRFLILQFFWVYLMFFLLIIFMKVRDYIAVPMMVYLVRLALLYAQKPVFDFRKKWLPVNLFPAVKLLGVIVGLIFVYPCASFYHEQNLEKQKKENQLRVYMQDMARSDKSLYILWAFPFEWINVFDNCECYRPFHMIFAGTYVQRSPALEENLIKLGIKDRNVFLAAIDNPNVILVCDQEEGYHFYKYLEENFHKSAYPKKVFDCPYFKAFTIQSKRPS
jgi:hypothetical protein